MDEVQPTGDGFPTLFSARYGQTYHSRHGARQEAEHVFLSATGVAERLQGGQATAVLEVGFGTGLNFLLTATGALEQAAELRYTALENDLLPASVLAELGYACRLGAPALGEAFVAWRDALPEAPAGTHACTLAPGIHLTLVLGDAYEAELPRAVFDAVYLDAFSPEVNPELWTPAFLQKLHAMLVPGGRLATYSAKGRVRRALVAAGFQVEKRPGPPGKREMLVGERGW